ncbi:MAG: hypothetical protein JNM02_14855 [Anaerolineales bacterium]|nr:hypothetical protein [Anaerolineales bacterium]
MRKRNILLEISIFLTTLFIAAQFYLKTTSEGGAWCSPYLGAPTELGHSAFQFVGYGFPMQSVTVVNEICSEETSTTYEWSPIGLSVNIFILATISCPVWLIIHKKNNKNKP